MKRVTLNGPGKNALSSAMLRFLLDEIQAAKGEPLLLTGTGDAFSAGLDLREVASFDERSVFDFLVLLEDAVSVLYTYPAPTVAALNGHAIAGGCVLALACDHRVATDGPKAKMGLNEVALGVVFPPRIGEIVRRRIPPQNRERVLLGGGLVDMAGALALGLVDELAADPVAVGEARLAALAAHPRGAYAATKATLCGRSSDTFGPNEEQERKLRAALPSWISSEVKARLTRVLAK